MNLNDAERLESYLKSAGFHKASEKDAEIIFVVACSVRQKALDRVWGKIKLWQKENKKVLITGCVLASDQKKFSQKNIPFFNITDLESLRVTLVKYFHALEYGSIRLDFFDLAPERSSKIAHITIMTGCDNFCSYCAVPYTRGREVSRPIDDIIDETKTAIANGYKEILLLGQNVNSYKYDFAKLIKKIDSLPGDFSFNFMSSNPHDMTPEIIEAFAKLKKWPRELHLAMQSGDDEILKKMNRKYDSGQYLALISKLKSQISNLRITTDIIVGFPGETKAHFDNTIELCKKIGFKKAYIGQYSPRPGTVSAKLPDDVSSDEKKRRWMILNELINTSSKS